MQKLFYVKKVRILLVLLFASSVLFAAPRKVRPRHFLDVDFGGGLHTLTYKADKVDKGMGGGGMLKVQYQLMFNESWGLGAGVQFSSYLGSTKWDKFSNSYKRDAEGKDFTHPEAFGGDETKSKYTLIVRAKGVEKQQLYAVQVPVQVIYLHRINRRLDLQAGFGFTFDIPMYAQYKTKDMSVKTSGLFEAVNVEIESDVNPKYGFYNQIFNEKGKLDLNNFNLGLQAEACILKEMGDKSAFKIGAYLNYGILDYTKTSLYTPFDARAGLKYVSAYATNLITAVHPFEVGLKLGFHIRMGR